MEKFSNEYFHKLANDLKFDLSDQEKKNESLTMKVNELTSFSKVDEVVKEMGLVYNYENIVNIDK